MSYTAKKLLQIAAGEIGYIEKETNSQLDNPTANAGDGNYTKYARDLAAAGYYQASKQGFEWCDCWVDWCFLQLCGSREKAEELTCQSGPYGAGCYWSAQYYKQAGRFYTSDPEPGDQIFLNGYNHTGIVEKVNGAIIFTIEGNTDNRVARRSYNINVHKIDGYGRPKYDVENPGESGENPEPVRIPIGEIVNFTGSRHYISAHSGTGHKCNPGKATITAYYEDAPHPYHVIHTDNDSNVYGWVDAADIEQIKKQQDPQGVTVQLPMIRQGDTGESVRSMQILLIGRGYGCGVAGADGDFGPDTAAALEKLQQDHGLSVDRICGSESWSDLLGI